MHFQTDILMFGKDKTAAAIHTEKKNKIKIKLNITD